MTAIVGVINSGGVVFAADSAGTVDDGHTTKIFNTANKIFSLSNDHPIGVAIYSVLHYMGHPWETIIKEYRKKCGETTYDNIEGYRDGFIKFLTDDFKPSNEHLTNFVGVIGYRLNESILADDSSGADPKAILLARINALDVFIKGLPKASAFTIDKAYLTGTFQAQIDDSATNLVERAAEKIGAISLDQDIKDAYGKCLHSYFVSDSFLLLNTGIVFFGFGETELLPSIASIKIEGLLNGIPRWIEHPIDVSSSVFRIESSVNAAILPFAQDDITKKIVNGIAPSLRNFVYEQYREKSDALKLELATYLKDDPNGTAAADKNQAKVDALIDHKLTEFKASINERIQSNHTKRMLDALVNLGIEDMVELAESLIKLTSLKRKISNVNETVGGPIDIAVITKGDGFIWIKRKHYFRPELNKAYFNRS